MVRLVLFDIDGTLVHTGHAGTQAFKKTFATEFDLHHGAEKIKFAGRTDVSLVREFFKIHALPNPPMLGLLTGNIKLGAEIKLRHYNLWEHFHFGGFADDHEERDQIAAAAFERGKRVLGKNLRAEEIVVIGDTQFDIRCGKFIGAKVLAVATGGAKFHELKSHSPDWLVEDLTQIRAEEICGRDGVSPSLNKK